LGLSLKDRCPRTAVYFATGPRRRWGKSNARFDAYANSYRAQVERLLGNQEVRTGQDEDGIRRDLESLENTLREKTLAS
jgi:hypothetical protein